MKYKSDNFDSIALCKPDDKFTSISYNNYRETLDSIKKNYKAIEAEIIEEALITVE